MKVSASIFATNERLLAYVSQLKDARVDYLHLDFFQNGTNKFHLEDIKALDYLQMPYDVHLIYDSITAENIELLNNSRAEILSLQLENLLDVEQSLTTMEFFKGDIGLAVTPGTDINELCKYVSRIDHILVMCSTPGISGAKFLEDSYDYIREVRDLFPYVKIHTDGGIDAKRCKLMDDLGISLAVSGSYLFNNCDNMRDAVTLLKHPNRHIVLKKED